MNFWTLGTDFQLSPLEERTQFAKSLEDFCESHSSLMEEFVLVSTCNRVELYAWSETAFSEILTQWKQSTEAPLNFRKLEASQALRHLCRVTASLESMVIGETQITGQVRRAYEKSSENGQVKTRMHRVFQEALRCAKRVRSETEVGQFAVSVPSVGVKLAEKVFGNLARRRVAILGLGEIGRLAAEHFACVAPKRFALFNRTREVAESLKDNLSDQLSQIEILESDYIQKLPQYDVIVAAASAKLIAWEDLQEINRQNPQCLVLDLGVPACVEKREDLDLFLYGIDDLKRISEENTQLREQELEKANRLVFSEAEKIWQKLEGLDIGQTLKLLAQKTEESRRIELKELKNRLNGVSEENWAEIEKMSERLSSKILQDPIRELRTRLELAEERETWLEFFRNIFRI